ncbi:MAG: hypothetical protein A2275_07760 [Bacteroidetes bacterium RIFOXYA12_FULL_35_11]|nr:MAG: hypothetical protein A2X01_15245 [Bacteroidetes bacterium GWF2_35_48]OFY75064.1 MAG: hypothetical protein A2275_07760 [Bacteroidetes bacterium RIFOXYA12_FULL_35_11]OFY97248.1 MAG: hypothetical protein A2309_12090 [Bacteroidetes bacterium RIFOXYB2_FULL_35_7]OFZ03578.1 MAG: hypothetical protein A2491_05150 [Bacteroidetes bacterium RIFOXYC12_FULL_35_7]
MAKTGFSQDSHLSMTDDAPVLMNPSHTGTYDGSFRFHLQHRSQWKSMLSKSFLTEVFSAEMNLRPFGAGLLVLNNHAGVGNFNQFGMYASGSYEVTIDPNKYHHLFCGVQLGFVQNSINIASLTFDNQYTMSGGGGFDITQPTGENFTKTSAIAPDVNFGISYIALKKMNYFSSFVYKTSTWTPYGGITGFHLTQPKLTFSEFKNKLSRRWLFYGGVKYKINTNLCVDPNIQWENQAKVNDFKFGSYGYYYIGSYQVFAMTGIHYRMKDALVLSMGGLYKQYALKLGYDINISKLNVATRGRGGFEISFTYTFLNEQSYSLL